jgi:hypothetical protein
MAGIWVSEENGGWWLPIASPVSRGIQQGLGESWTGPQQEIVYQPTALRRPHGDTWDSWAQEL